jgi:hypothetical protein
MVMLSTPCNGFFIGIEIPKGGAIYLSTPCNGFLL